MSSNISSIDYLLSIPMFQQIGAVALNPSLDKIQEFDAFLGHPHQKYKTIHVGGTNGKGSVSHMLCSVLMSSGYKVGLYTSPHLKSFNERIRVNGEEIETEFIDVFVEKTRPLIEKMSPSFFEVTTALAFDYFAEKDVDVAIIEVGLGGVFDATNIITPVLSVITNISKDHTSILGDTIEEIASQKAGIIKNDVPVVVGESDNKSDVVFIEKARKVGAEIVFADKSLQFVSSKIMSDYQVLDVKDGFGEVESFSCELKGRAQRKNVLTVLSSCRLLKKHFTIDDNSLKKGLNCCVSSTNLKGRWQILSNSPLTICDTAHNKAGITEVVEQLRELNYNKLYMVFGVVSDKDITAILSLLPQNAYYIFTKAQINRALDEKELKKLAEGFGLEGETQNTVQGALNCAKELAERDDLIFVGGSNFVVSEVI